MTALDMKLDLDSSRLKALRREATGRFLRAAKEAIGTTADNLDRDLTRAAEQAGLGKLGRSFKSRVYPRGSGLAYVPSADVFVAGGPRSRGAIAAYTQGARISGKRGQYLAIPTPQAGPKNSRAGVALTPGLWEKRTGLRLRFVYRPGKASLLVLDEGVLSGKRGLAKLNTEKRRATGRGNTTIVIFILIPFADVKKRFSVEAITGNYPGRLKAEFLAKLRALPQG